MPNSLEAITHALKAIDQNLAAQTQIILLRTQTIDRINVEGEAEVRRLLRLPNPGVEAGEAMARLNARMVQTNQHCFQGIEAILPQLDDAVKAMEQEVSKVGSYINPSSPTEKEAAIELRKSMRAASKEAAVTIQKFIFGTGQLTESPNLSPEVNTSTKRVRLALESTLECLKRFERACDVLVASIDEAL